MYDVICSNCGHLLYYAGSAYGWEHFTRYYRSHGFPYSTVGCFAPGCRCCAAEPVEVLA